jgi:predicted RNase H-like HicB family nuclease
MPTTIKHFPLLIEMDEDGYHIVSCPLFEGCHSYGNTIEEAMQNIAEVIEMCLAEPPMVSSNQFIGLHDLEIASV